MTDVMTLGVEPYEYEINVMDDHAHKSINGGGYVSISGGPIYGVVSFQQLERYHYLIRYGLRGSDRRWPQNWHWVSPRERLTYLLARDELLEKGLIKDE